MVGRRAAEDDGANNDALLLLQRALARCGGYTAMLVFAISAALLVFLSATLFLQVVFRYLIQQPLPWTEEAARYALVWYAMLAAAAAAWSGQHFVFRWVTLLVPEGPRRVLKLAVSLVTLALLLVMIVVSWRYVQFLEGQTTIATQIDMRIPYSGVPAGLSLLLVIYLFDFADSLLALRTGQSFSERHKRDANVELDLMKKSLGTA
jgi:TRAP-type C4-dicarboxylate transport system permease small subunit